MPPRNPVFQCWGGDIDWNDEDSEEAGDTSEEDSEMRQKSIDVDDSVLPEGRKLATDLQREIESIKLRDGSNAVSECDVHLDLTTIPSE